MAWYAPLSDRPSPTEAALASLSKSLCRYHSLAPITYSVGERMQNTFTYAPTRKHERLSPLQTSGHVRGFSTDILDLGDRFSSSRAGMPVMSGYASGALRPPPASVVSTTAYDKTAFADGGGNLSQFSRSRTPFGEVPISCVYGFDYPLANSANSLQETWRGEDMERRLRNHESLRGSVDNLMRTGLGDDPWLDWDNSVGGYWPRLRDSTPIRSTVRARSASPVRHVPIFSEAARRSVSPPPTRMNSSSLLPPLAATPRQSYYRDAPYNLGVQKLREFGGRSTPLRTTSIGFHSSTPWNATGFYYSPRYPESYRGTSSTLRPYAHYRAYYDNDINNPYRKENYFFQQNKDYGYVPYKYARKNRIFW